MITGTLHIGGGIVLGAGDIIGIFSGTAENKQLIEEGRAKGLTRNMAQSTRSFVLAKKKGRLLIYCTGISGRNLIKRAILKNKSEEDYGQKR